MCHILLIHLDHETSEPKVKYFPQWLSLKLQPILLGRPGILKIKNIFYDLTFWLEGLIVPVRIMICDFSDWVSLFVSLSVCLSSLSYTHTHTPYHHHHHHRSHYVTKVTADNETMNQKHIYHLVASDPEGGF